jgi:hypothetical protein
MLADAIRDPDEIWMNWQAVKSQPYVLRRRYLKAFTIEGESRPGLAVYEEGKDGWAGITLFAVDDTEVRKHGWQDAMAYIQGQRGGFLVYRRK